MTIDYEKSFFNLLKRESQYLFPTLCDRTRFNRTKRNLYAVIENIREHISMFMQSLSSNVCEFWRAHFSKCFKGEASYGRCPSRKQTYYRFKFHVLTNTDGFLTDFIITPANVDDRLAVWDLCDKYKEISIIGDKGYVNRKLTPEF